MAHETFHIPIEAAEIYEAEFVPAIFAEWAPVILDAARVGPGDRMLDVACGTGIVGRTAADLVGAGGRIVGLDANGAMLEVARRVRPDIEWFEGPAEDLPFPDDTFDAAVSQMALMFFTDRVQALTEMRRVVRDGGRLGIVVPAALEDQPAYRVFVDTAVRHAGADARSLLGTYWNCGDLSELESWIEAAGWQVTETRTRPGTAHFDSPASFVRTEVEGSPLAERIEPAVRRAIEQDVASELSMFDQNDHFAVPLLCHVIAAVA